MCVCVCGGGQIIKRLAWDESRKKRERERVGQDSQLPKCEFSLGEPSQASWSIYPVEVERNGSLRSKQQSLSWSAEVA